MTTVDAASTVFTAMADVQPQTNKLRWEQEWLRENRDAFAVIADKPERDPASAEHDTSRPSARAAEQQRETITHTGTQTSVEMAGAMESAAIPQTVSAVPQSFLPGTAWAAEFAVRVQLDAAAAAVPTTEPRAPGTGPRGAWPQFALWRDADEAHVALRIDATPLREREIIAALRRWLKESGLTLSTVIVNGVRRWQRPPRDGF